MAGIRVGLSRTHDGPSVMQMWYGVSIRPRTFALAMLMLAVAAAGTMMMGARPRSSLCAFAALLGLELLGSGLQRTSTAMRANLIKKVAATAAVACGTAMRHQRGVRLVQAQLCDGLLQLIGHKEIVRRLSLLGITGVGHQRASELHMCMPVSHCQSQAGYASMGTFNLLLGLHEKVELLGLLAASAAEVNMWASVWATCHHWLRSADSMLCAGTAVVTAG